MRLLVIGDRNSYECRRLTEEGRRLKHRVTVAGLQDLFFEVPGRLVGGQIRLGRRPIDENFDTVYIRQLFPYVSEALFLAEWADSRGMRVIDRQLATGNYVQSKIYASWKLAENGLPVIPGFQAMRLDLAKRRLAKTEKPAVAKGIHGSQGKYVFRLDNPKKEIDGLNDDLIGLFTFQDLLKIDCEYRVLVIGGKHFGAVKKTAPTGDFRRNMSLGARAETAELPTELKRMCVRAAKVLGHEFSGIDLAVSRRRPYVIEVNRCPGFSGFEQATGKNVARRFLETAAGK
ncbi:hypothetical protein JW899_03855 [Candidatus Uhrbacteria bacterium]|nr:hypothetical protein [Candidatus Uhrbacteria bacterium]